MRGAAGCPRRPGEQRAVAAGTACPWGLGDAAGSAHPDPHHGDGESQGGPIRRSPLPGERRPPPGPGPPPAPAAATSRRPQRQDPRGPGARSRTRVSPKRNGLFSHLSPRRQPRLRRRSLSWHRRHDRSPGGSGADSCPSAIGTAGGAGPGLGMGRTSRLPAEKVSAQPVHRPVRQPGQARGPRGHRGGVGPQRTGAGGGSGPSARGSAMPDGALPIARSLCDLGVTLPIALGNAPKSRRPWAATAHGSSADLQDSPQATCNLSNGSCRMGGGGVSPPGTHAPATECPGAAYGHRGAGWTHP
jgi:hypothetical protein